MSQRILVYGVTGSGKTTLARRIADKTGIEFFPVDDLSWNPDWVLKSEEDMRTLFGQICKGESWILDSAYGVWLDVALERATLIVALDYPRWLSLNRLLWRTCRRVLDKQKVCNGNVETLRQAFSRDSIVAWHFRSFASKRARIRRFEQLEGVKVLTFRHPREAERWLADLSA